MAAKPGLAQDALPCGNSGRQRVKSVITTPAMLQAGRLQCTCPTWWRHSTSRLARLCVISLSHWYSDIVVVIVVSNNACKNRLH